MYKYWLLFRTYMQNTLAYPVSFWMWRFRQLLSTFASITVWIAIFQSQSQVFGYSRDQMISYVFLIGFLQSMILATQTNGLSQQIYEGHISNIFVKPLNVFGWLLTQDLADKFYNFSFLIFETLLLFWLFRPNISLPSSIYILPFLVSTLLGAVLFFLIMLLLGAMGFWTRDTWGIRFLLYMFTEFTAGRAYPLSIFPDVIQRVLYWTPFPYLSYMQSQIFLEKMTWSQINQGLAALILWIVILAVAFRHFWQKGLKEYGAMGH